MSQKRREVKRTLEYGGLYETTPQTLKILLPKDKRPPVIIRPPRVNPQLEEWKKLEVMRLVQKWIAGLFLVSLMFGLLYIPNLIEKFEWWKLGLFTFGLAFLPAAVAPFVYFFPHSSIWRDHHPIELIGFIMIFCPVSFFSIKAVWDGLKYLLITYLS